jgi:hypothetical protein
LKILDGVAAFGMEAYQKGIDAGNDMVDFAYHAEDHKKAIATGFRAANPDVRNKVPWAKAASASKRTKVPEGAGVVKWLPTLALLFLNTTFATLLRGDSFCMLTMACVGFVAVQAQGKDYKADVIRFVSRRSKTNKKANIVLTYVSRQHTSSFVLSSLPISFFSNL